MTERHPGLEITTEQVDGRPLTVLVAAAQEAEVLVLGSRGLGAMTGFLVGSVSQAVLAQAKRPVVVVRPGAWLDADCLPGSDGDAPRKDKDRPVVLGLDLSYPSTELLDHAFDAAAVRRAPLRVIHRWSMPPAFAFDPALLAPEVRDGMATSMATALADELLPWRDKYPEVRVEVDCSVGQPANQLVEASADASLVVVGRMDTPLRHRRPSRPGRPRCPPPRHSPGRGRTPRLKRSRVPGCPDRPRLTTDLGATHARRARPGDVHRPGSASAWRYCVPPVSRSSQRTSSSPHRSASEGHWPVVALRLSVAGGRSC